MSTLWTQLTWSHLRLLFNLEIDSVNYYIQVVVDKHLSVRELEFKIKSNEYERIPIESRFKLMSNEKLKPNDLIPNPIMIKNSNNYKNISSSITKTNT